MFTSMLFLAFALLTMITVGFCSGVAILHQMD